MKYKRYTLKELATIKYGKNQAKVVTTEKKYPIYGTGGLMGYATQFLYDKPSVLIGRKGTIDKIRYVEHPFWTVDTLFYTEINTDIVIPEYFYYALSLIDLAKHNEGTTFPSLRTDTLNKIEFDIPDIEEQRKIIGILRPISDKIALNEQINNNLQHQAKALFQDWFVDFAPFGGVMPSDWKNGKLKYVIRLKLNAIKAGEDPSLPYLPIDIIPMNTFAVTDFKPNSEAQSSLITFDRDDIVIGAMRVYFHRVICAPCKGITRTTCFTLAPFDTAYLSFALLCCDQNSSIDYAQTTSKGSTMPYAVWEGGLGDMDILIPTREIALKFNELVLPMLRIIQSSYFENHHLRTVRDILLTKLLSGEIDVSEIEF